jgi:hypothetical protein
MDRMGEQLAQCIKRVCEKAPEWELATEEHDAGRVGGSRAERCWMDGWMDGGLWVMGGRECEEAQCVLISGGPQLSDCQPA